MRMKAFHLLALIILTVGCWLSITPLWGFRGPGWLIVLAIVAWLCVSALVLAARKMGASVWIYAGLVILAGLFLPASMLVEILPERLSLPFGTLVAIMFLLILPMALVIAALLLYSGLNLYQAWQHGGTAESRDSQAQRKHAGRTAAAAFVLSALLLVRALHSLYWLTVWDNTDDPLGYLWLIGPVMVLLLSGVMLSITLPGRTKLAGFLYPLLISAVMIAVSARAQGVDFHQLTEERARRTSEAIETYYAREGRYPQDLRQLTPWSVLSLPGPVIIFGQGWCYDGGEDYYRLGYVDREHWSDPRLTGQIHKTIGEAPDLHPICDKEIAALRKRYPQHFLMAGE